MARKHRYKAKRGYKSNNHTILGRVGFQEYEESLDRLREQNEKEEIQEQDNPVRGY